MNGRLAIIVLLTVALLGGCAHREREGWRSDGHPFSPIPESSRVDRSAAPATPEAVAPPPEEKPIVRVISGAEVSGPEEALALLTAKRPEEPPGLRATVEQLAVNGAPLVQVATALSELSGYNIVVSGKAAVLPVTVHLRNLPLRQALEAICRLNDLWYREDERIVTLMTTEEYSREMVIRRNEKSRAYWLRYTNANDMARVLQAVMSSKVQFNDIGAEEVYGHVSEEKEAGTSLAVDQTVEDALGKLAPEELKKLRALGQLGAGEENALELNRQLDKSAPTVITVFKRNNSIIARSLDEAILEDIGRIIELMDTPTSQVLLEISILQINLTGGFESFFRIDFPGSYKFSAGTLGSSSGVSSETLDMLFGNDNIRARLELYARDDRVKVMSTPYLMSANNAKVEFFVGQEVPLRDDVESKVLYDDDGEITTTTFEVTIKREELGTDIDIASFINEDGTITMDLEAEISAPQYNMTSIGVVSEAAGEIVNFPLDGVERSELTSMVTAASGQTIAIGGIIKEELQEYENKVPLLGDAPGLGFFFREVHDTKQKTETVILLTPHIIRHPERAGEASSEFLQRRSSHPQFTEDVNKILDYPTVDSNNQTSTREKPCKFKRSNRK